MKEKVSKDYIKHLLDQSEYEGGVMLDTIWVLAAKLPNGKILIGKSKFDLDDAKKDIEEQLYDLEEYLQLDKDFYDYDLDEEFYEERGE